MPETVAIPSTTPAVPLPNWTDSGSITAYVVSLATAVLALLTMTGVTVPANTSSEVSAWAGIAGIVVAAGVQGFNFFRMTVLHKAAIVSGHAVGIKTKAVVVPVPAAKPAVSTKPAVPAKKAAAS
jgi:hypothetical protein